MLGTTLSRTSGSAALNGYGRPRKSYQSTVDQAREYATTCGPDSASAFDQLSRTTALVLRAYIATVYEDNRSFSKVVSIRDAMKEYFEDVFGCWGTSWQFVPDCGETMIGEVDENKVNESGEWVGNPVFDEAFVDMMKGLEELDDKSDRTQVEKRRADFSYKDIMRLMLHLQKPEIVEAEGPGRCLFFQAFAATAFTLWLTFDEALKLKRRHLSFRQSTFQGSPWFTVTVPFRKTNLADPSLANVYEIYPQLEEPHACCVTKVLAWLEWIDTNGLCEPNMDDFLFPQLSKDNHIDAQQPFSVSILSNRLNKYAHDAGLMDHRNSLFDKHCFRRGGAQHRLFHARDPWPFQSVKWWGGWSEKEPAEKIKEYLCSETQYELSFEDMLSRHGSKTYGVTNMASQSLEVQVIRERFESVIQSIDSRHTAIFAKIEKENQELRQQIAGLRDTLAQELEKAVLAIKSREYADPHLPQPQVNPLQLEQASSEPQLDLPEPVPDLPQPPQDNRQSQPIPEPGLPQPVRSQQIKPKLPQPKQAQAQKLQSQPTRMRSRPKRLPHLDSQLHDQPAPSPRTRAPAITHWKEAIQYWEKSDPSTGLMTPLRDWNPTMQDGDQRYASIRTIAQEFEFHGRSETRMRQTYGDLLDAPLCKLLFAIRKVRQIPTSMEQGQTTAAVEYIDERARDGDHTVNSSECETASEGEDGEQPSEQNSVMGTLPIVPVIPRCLGWKDVLRQWDEGDPENGLYIPLSQWPPEWRSKTYFNRKLIATEFESFGRDEHKMRQEYGANMDGTFKFIQTIRAKHKERKGKCVVREGSQVQDGLTSDVDVVGDGGDEASRDGEEEKESEGRQEYHFKSIVHGTDSVPTQALPKMHYWTDAVKQWEEGDPAQGLTVPFRDWPAEMLVEKRARRNYNKRKMVAEEWEFFGRDAERMRQAHGVNMGGVNLILSSIKRRRKQQKKDEKQQKKRGKLQDLKKRTQEHSLGEEEWHSHAQELHNDQQGDHRGQPEEEDDDPLTRIRKLLLEHKRKLSISEA